VFRVGHPPIAELRTIAHPHVAPRRLSMHWLSEHWQENAVALVLAVIFAGIFAIVADAMSIGSRVREALRRFNNKRAERSITHIRERIGELEHRRKMLASRTAVLLLALQATLSTLLAVSAGMALQVLREIDVPAYLEHLAGLATKGHVDPRLVATPWMDNLLRGEILLGSLFLFIMGASSSIAGLRLASVDREEKLTKVVTQLDGEISDLRTKETALSQRDATATSSKEKVNT
jgi:hypothetical protein